MGWTQCPVCRKMIHDPYGYDDDICMECLIQEQEHDFETKGKEDEAQGNSTKVSVPKRTV